MNKMKTLTLQGVTFEVVDEQARADIDVLKENSGSGGASSWNDLTDKPFGETTVKGDTLTWDGNTEGLVSMDAFAEMIGTLYKISDAVPTLEDCISGATYTVACDGEQENRSVGYDEIAEMSGFCGCLCIGDFYALVAPENNFQIEIEGVTAIFPEAGLYTNTGGDALLASLTIPGYKGFEATVIKPLDEKYLPEALQFGEEKAFEPIVWDSSMSGLEVFSHEQLMGVRYFKMGAYFQLENASDVEALTVRMMVDGQQMEDTDHGGADIREHGWLVADAYVVASDGNFELTGGMVEGIVFPNGIWFMDLTAVGAEQASLALNPSTTVKPMDEKYMPILTSPSGKKFKLSVDDSGVLSATEV